MNTKSRNVYTPFFRRLTDERAQDLRDTAKLQRTVLQRWRNSIWSKPTTLPAATDLCLKRLNDIFKIPTSIERPFKDAIADMLSRETPIFGSTALERPVSAMTLEEQVYLRRALRSQEYFLDNDDRVAELCVDAIVVSLAQVGLALPQIDEGPTNLTISLMDVIDVGNVAQSVFEVITSDRLVRVGLFTSLQDQLYINACRANGVEPFTDHGTLQGASELKAPPREVAERYLADTPFFELLQLRLPWRIPDKVRSTHILMIAPTGSGKTQWIQQDIYQNFEQPDSPGMVGIDSQNQMIPNLQRLRIARDRIIIIDPFDYPPPALNMFIAHKRKLSAHAQEIAEAQTIEQFAWVFSALEQDLSGRMKTLFNFTVRILMDMAPHSNMRTMLEFLRLEKPTQLKGSRFWEYIKASDEDTRYFFEERFCTGDYNRTKAGVADRLLGVLRIPAFARMFTASDNRLDMYAELAARNLIVFNTHKRGLQPEASAVLGRYAIALYVKAAFEREDDPDPPPAFLYVDEASEYFGKKDSSDTLFTQLRKFNCGTFVAFQQLSQLGEQTATIMENTTTKIAARINPREAGHLAPEMRTKPSVLDTVKADGRFQMAAYIKEVTPQALTFSFPYGVVENAAKLSDAEHAALRERNRERLGAETKKPPTSVTASEQTVIDKKPTPSRPATEATGVKTSSISPDDSRHIKPVKE